MSASLVHLLHRVNQIATEQFAAKLGDRDMTARQVQILAAIEANEGSSQTRIVELTGVDRSTLADVVQRLLKNKLIERRRSKLDARAYVLKLTASGRRALADGQPALDDVEKALLSALPPRARADLKNMLAALVQQHDA